MKKNSSEIHKQKKLCNLQIECFVPLSKKKNQVSSKEKSGFVALRIPGFPKGKANANRSLHI